MYILPFSVGRALSGGAVGQLITFDSAHFWEEWVMELEHDKTRGVLSQIWEPDFKHRNHLPGTGNRN
jgi:hypothetical protein